MTSTAGRNMLSGRCLLYLLNLNSSCACDCRLHWFSSVKNTTKSPCKCDVILEKMAYSVAKRAILHRLFSHVCDRILWLILLKERQKCFLQMFMSDKYRRLWSDAAHYARRLFRACDIWLSKTFKSSFHRWCHRYKNRLVNNDIDYTETVYVQVNTEFIKLDWRFCRSGECENAMYAGCNYVHVILDTHSNSRLEMASVNYFCDFPKERGNVLKVPFINIRFEITMSFILVCLEDCFCCWL